MPRRISLTHPLATLGEGLIVIPFGFKVNGADPVELHGDGLVKVVRSAAGKWLCTLRDKPRGCVVGMAEVSTIADSTDLVGKVDWSTVATAGTFTVRTITGAVQTDPTSGLLVGGVLVCRSAARRARRRAP